ncbi:MAG: RsmB/NOP family class I SAM-dependent RNA methyltransferase [Candidatus Aenigmatarchaeota archaeon]
MPKRFIERYENIVDDKEAFFSTLLKRTKKSFRVNTLKSSVSEVRKRMKSYGIEIKNMEWYPEAFVSENPFVSSTLEHFLGYIYMQELASMLPVLAARKDIRKAELVLDCCAAPGSKTTQMAAIMKDRGTIIANDLSYERIRALKFNLEKSGVLNAVITNQDIRFFKGGDKLRFDVVILDAPCSSEGTVRKNPGILRNWSENYIHITTTRMGFSSLK